MWVLWLWACSPEGGFGTAPGEPREWDGDFRISDVTIDCDGYYAWTYSVGTDGWGDAVTVDVVVREFGAVTWAEHHELPEVDYGEDWAYHSLEIDQVQDPDEYADSRSTLIACEAKTLVTYAFGARGYDGQIEDCVAYGVDPTGEFPDCESLGTVSH